MKERPILFNGPMVRAILDGSKTQTRRIVKVSHGTPTKFLGHDDTGALLFDSKYRCPFGETGDRLWVREAWRSTSDLDAHSGARMAELCLDAGYRSPWAPIQYEADTTRRNWEHTTTPPHDREPAAGRYRHARFMPRWASRITLEVTAVRVERLQSISDADAESEGIDFLRYVPDADETLTPSQLFMCLWDSVAPKGTDWAANPWVWVIEFQRVTASQQLEPQT